MNSGKSENARDKGGTWQKEERWPDGKSSNANREIYDGTRRCETKRSQWRSGGEKKHASKQKSCNEDNSYLWQCPSCRDDHLGIWEEVVARVGVAGISFVTGVAALYASGCLQPWNPRRVDKT